jgi:hypothetical protein
MVIEVIAQLGALGGWLGLFGEIFTILGDILLGVVGFFSFLSII